MFETSESDSLTFFGLLLILLLSTLLLLLLVFDTVNRPTLETLGSDTIGSLLLVFPLVLLAFDTAKRPTFETLGSDSLGLCCLLLLVEVGAGNGTRGYTGRCIG